jgi:hypothetical protein
MLCLYQFSFFYCEVWLPSKREENFESLNLKVDPLANAILDKVKAEGNSKSGFLLEALTFYKWFNNRASYRLTKENVRSRELLKAIRVDMERKKATNAELMKIDEALDVVEAVLKRLEVEGEQKL